jgi:hypothetical protein
VWAEFSRTAYGGDVSRLADVPLENRDNVKVTKDNDQPTFIRTKCKLTLAYFLVITSQIL